MLPPLVLGIFDQFVGARMLDRYPELYKLGQSNAFFGKRIFWAWVINAIWQSIVCSSHRWIGLRGAILLTCWHGRQVIYVCCAAIFWESLVLGGGRTANIWVCSFQTICKTISSLSLQSHLAVRHDGVLSDPRHSTPQGSTHLRVSSFQSRQLKNPISNHM